MSTPWKVVRLRACATEDEGWRKARCECGTVDEPHGEPLWPERWNCKALADLRHADATVWESSFQQEPTVGGGFWLAAIPPQFYENAGNHDARMLAANGGIAPPLNVYMLCDPALSKLRKADRTTIGIVGLGDDMNFYLLDLVWDRLSPSERADHIFRLHRKWRPLNVGYEEYGLQSDTVELKSRMERENYRFTVTPLGRSGNWHNLSKGDRISTIVPQAQSGRWWFPNPSTKERDPTLAHLTRRFINEEWNRYPACIHDDVLDMLSRINDPELKVVFPKPRGGTPYLSQTPMRRGGPDSWMMA